MRMCKYWQTWKYRAVKYVSTNFHSRDRTWMKLKYCSLSNPNDMGLFSKAAPRVNLYYKLVSIQFREYEQGLSKTTRVTSLLTLKAWPCNITEHFLLKDSSQNTQKGRSVSSNLAISSYKELEECYNANDI